MGSCNQNKGRICAEKGESIPIVEREKRRDMQVHFRTIEKRVYQVLKITLNSTSILCRKGGWEEAHGIGL